MSCFFSLRRKISGWDVPFRPVRWTPAPPHFLDNPDGLVVGLVLSSKLVWSQTGVTQKFLLHLLTDFVNKSSVDFTNSSPHWLFAVTFCDVESQRGQEQNFYPKLLHPSHEEGVPSKGVVPKSELDSEVHSKVTSDSSPKGSTPQLNPNMSVLLLSLFHQPRLDGFVKLHEDVSVPVFLSVSPSPEVSSPSSCCRLWCYPPFPGLIRVSMAIIDFYFLLQPPRCWRQICRAASTFSLLTQRLAAAASVFTTSQSFQKTGCVQRWGRGGCLRKMFTDNEPTVWTFITTSMKFTVLRKRTDLSLHEGREPGASSWGGPASSPRLWSLTTKPTGLTSTEVPLTAIEKAKVGVWFF